MTDNVTKNNRDTLILLIFSGIIYLILLYVLVFIQSKLPFTFSALLGLFIKDPALIAATILPFIFIYFYTYFQEKIQETEKRYTLIIDRDKQSLEKYAVYAKKIGTGDLTGQLETEGPEDKLGNALIMIESYLRSNIKKENQQFWISEGKEMISRILRTQTNINDLSLRILKTLINYIGAVQGAFYIYNNERKKLINTALFAYNRKRYICQEFSLGEGLVGECAYEMDYVYRTEIPEDYVTITSGLLGDQKPSSILLVPLISDDSLQGVMEFAFLSDKIPKLTIQFLLELGEVIGRTLLNLKLSRKTEILLEESRKMTEELRKNEQKLQENASLMAKTQEELRNTNEQLEAKMAEVQQAQGRLHWLLENASEVISIYSSDLHMVYVSPSVTKILGYTPEEMMQGKDFERLTREGADSLRKLLEITAADSEIIPVIQYSFIKKDGVRIYLETSAKNLLNDPAVRGIILNSRDITEKIRAEREERLKTRMQSLSENSLDIILRISTSGQFYYVNPVVEDYIPLGSKQLINKSLSEVDMVKVLKDYFNGTLVKMSEIPRKMNTELSIPVKMGEKLTERIISFDAIPEFTNNELETILFVGHDITEAKRIEKEIQVKNKNIEDSINYARRIQGALLPDLAMFRKYFPRSFVFYKPRDVISGDFPWFFVKNEWIYIAAIDCTGHGVPGALLSFIGFFLLNNVADHAEELSASEILDSLNESVRKTLKQSTEKSEARDGMDIALCKINLKKTFLEFAGAHRPLFLLSEGELTEFKGDRKAIGGVMIEKKLDEKFVNNAINIRHGDKIFFFTDGLTDQLGGPYGRKYSPKRVRDLILEYPGYTMQQYYSLFEYDFAQWQEGFKQLDDLLMIGIEF